MDLTLNVMQKVEIPCLPKKNNKKTKEEEKKTACILLGSSTTNNPIFGSFSLVPSLHMLWYICYRKVVFETEAQRLFSVERSELYVSYLVQSEGPASGL